MLLNFLNEEETRATCIFRFGVHTALRSVLHIKPCFVRVSWIEVERSMRSSNWSRVNSGGYVGLTGMGRSVGQVWVNSPPGTLECSGHSCPLARSLS